MLYFIALPPVAAALVIVPDTNTLLTFLFGILVGPGGVFAIDTKNRRKRVEVVDSIVYTGGHAKPRLVENVRGIAAQINSVIKTSTPHNVWVEGVLVFWAVFPQNFANSDRISFVAGETLTPWIYSLETRLNREQVDTIVAAIEGMPDGVLLGAAES